jgi:tetratricopeptide (TPR) repeat protein
MYYDKDNLHHAFLQYEKSLGLEPDNFRVRYKKALSLLSGGMNEDAIKEFRAVLKKNPDYALAYEGLGQAYFQMKKYEEGTTYFIKAVKLDVTLWKARTYLGIIYDQNKKHEMAIKEYKEAIALNPKVGLLYNNLGVSYYEAGENERAVSAFKDAIKRRYDNGKVYNNLGMALSKAGKYEEALMAFTNAGDEAKAYNNLGCIFLQQGEYKKAINYFEKAINITPYFYDIANKNLRKAKVGYRDIAPTRNGAGMNDMGDNEPLLGNKMGIDSEGDDHNQLKNKTRMNEIEEDYPLEE